ncbi:MAG: PH domain-containing protein [Mycolicibacterium sp.]|jgi:hypothetical protein|nr:PH domain-containing protein [Mycolicibacterium sp.]
MADFQQTQWGPTTGSLATLAVAGAALLTAAVMLVTDLPGRVLLVTAGTGIVLFACFTWRARPKLAITDDGLALRGWFRTLIVTRADLALLRITEFRRLGRSQRMLELETTDDQLRVFTRWDLGVDPLEVLDALTAAGYSAPRH